MMELKNVSRYYPENMPYGDICQYFQSEDGLDFYDVLEAFSAKFKLCIEPDTGVIHSVAEDVSTLYPVGFSIVETDNLPDGFNINGEWQFANGKVIPRIYTQNELMDMAIQKRDSLIQGASTKITALTDAQDDGDITESELTTLATLREYRTKLRRLDVTGAPDIEWPERP